MRDSVPLFYVQYMEKEFKGFNHGTGTIHIKVPGSAALEYKPIEVHLKENGSLKNEPSLAFVLVRPLPAVPVIAQISVEMLNAGLADIGYKLIKL